MADDKVFKIKAKNNFYEGLGKEQGKIWQGPFCFIQAADTQFGMIEGCLENKINPGWNKEIELTKKAIHAANEMRPKPRFFVICGDLIDALPDTQLRKFQENDFRKVFTELDSDIPLICVCGNHDVGDSPTKSTIENYKKKFGSDYYAFWCGGVMFIVLNSQFYEDSSLAEGLAKEHDEWLDKQLEEAKAGNYQHVVVFQHVPWFVHHADELKKGNNNIALGVRKKMLNKFLNAGVRAIFCGHMHENGGGFYEDMEVVVTSSVGAQLGDEESGLRVVRVLEDTIEHTYYSLDNIPSTILLDV